MTAIHHATTKISIHGVEFDAPAPYVEGHVLTAPEARALNGLLAENLRNNFRRRLAERGQDLSDPKVLATSNTAALHDEFAVYAHEYRLGGAQRPTRDPVAREALKIATALVRESYNRQGADIRALPEGEFDRRVGEIAKHDAVVAEATRRVEVTKQTLDSVLDGILG